MNSRDDNQVMTIQEVAAFLRFSRSKVYRLVTKDEKFPAKKIGGQWRIWLPALEAYLAEREAEEPRPQVVTPVGE